MNLVPELKRQLKPMALILACALGLGFLFNLVMPQGLGWLPRAVSHPLWQPLERDQARAMLTQGAMLIDARPAGDYAQARVRGALKLPQDEIAKLYPLMKPIIAQAPAVVVYGQTLSRFPAAVVAQHLRQRGHEKVYVIEGCMETLEKSGFPIQRPRRGAGS